MNAFHVLVCMHTYVYGSVSIMYAYACASLDALMYDDSESCGRICTCICVYKCMYMHLFVCKQMYTYIFEYTYSYRNKCTYVMHKRSAQRARATYYMTNENYTPTKETPTSWPKRPANWQKRHLDLDKRDLHALQGNSNVRNIGDHRAKKPPQQLF